MSSLTGRVFGYYHILERIGQGGMGTVYRALDRKAGREVAIKFISPAIAQQEVFLNRFRREVKAVARLQHPNIVPVLDYGEQSGYAYLVMPLLEVATLLDRLKSGPVQLALGARVMDQVSGALAHAHRHGVIHRDVKPSNILLDKADNARLSDFGLARVHDASASLTGSGLVGTPAYMAPEQARGGPVDARADQYALGVVLFYLATGSLPFSAEAPMEYLLKHVNEPFPSARKRNPRVPESVERVILKATAKDPDDRFGSVSEMNHALQGAIAHALDPVTHEAPTIELPAAAILASDRPAPRKRWRPMRVAVAAVAAVLLVLAVPVFASGLLGLLERASSPAEGSFIDPQLGQLILLEGTIEAMSTELARSQSDPEVIHTAIALTLTAAAPPGASQGEQPIASVTSGASALTPPSPTPTGELGTFGQLPGPSATPAAPSGTSPATRSGSSPPRTGTSPASPSPTTLTPGSTPASSATSRLASPTPSPSPTSQPASPTPTQSTSQPASPTPTQSPAPTAVATNTLIPIPTPAPTQDPCPLLDLGGLEVSGQTATWRISNGSSSTVVITRIVVDWPAGNGELDRVRFGGSSIWNGSAGSPPTEIGSGFTGNRSLEGGVAKALKFEFAGPAGPSGYDLQLDLAPGCQLSASG